MSPFLVDLPFFHVSRHFLIERATTKSFNILVFGTKLSSKWVQEDTKRVQEDTTWVQEATTWVQEDTKWVTPRAIVKKVIAEKVWLKNRAFLSCPVWLNVHIGAFLKCRFSASTMAQKLSKYFQHWCRHWRVHLHTPPAAPHVRAWSIICWNWYWRVAEIGTGACIYTPRRQGHQHDPPMSFKKAGLDSSAEYETPRKFGSSWKR